LGFNAWGVGIVFRNATSRMEKDEIYKRWFDPPILHMHNN
jgi:hypothetical protein